jgi:hypothetical protein
VLRAKALSLVQQQQPEAAQWFKGSPDFFRAFEKKNNLSMRRKTTSAPKLPPGETQESMRSVFLARGASIVQLNGIPDFLVFGADETAQHLTPAKNSTLEVKGAKNVQVLGSGLPFFVVSRYIFFVLTIYPFF